jgi:hypothetical protein
MSIHQTNKTDLMGPSRSNRIGTLKTGYPWCALREVSASSGTDRLSSQTTDLFRTENQLQEIAVEPKESLEHLGFRLERHSMTIRLPASKVRDLRRSIQSMLSPLSRHPGNTQFDNEDKGSNISIVSCQSIHSSTPSVQECVSETASRLGPSGNSPTTNA